MNKQQLRISARNQSRWHRKQEIKWHPRVKKALDANVDAFIKYAKDNSITAAVAIIDTLIDMKPVADVLHALYRGVGLERARQVRNSLTGQMRKSDDFTQFILEAMSQFFFNLGITYSVMSIIATQRKRILAFILQHFNRELTDEQLTDVLNNPNFIREALQREPVSRSEEDKILLNLRVEASDRGLPAIVRTEVTRALNYGAYTAAKRLPFMVRKIWLSLHDLRTRRAHNSSPWDHWEPLGQTVDLEDPFVVSGELLMYPGDPSGSKQNVIGCRCGQEFVAVKDDRGRVIMKPTEPTGITIIRPGGTSNITGIITI